VLLAGLVWAGFVAQQGWGPVSLALLAALLAAACMAAVAWHNTPNGQIRWDGEQWHWSGAQDRMVRSMACVLDLQSVVLLHIRCDQGKSHWLWLESGDKPKHWKALRRAIVASKPGTPDGASAEPQEG
jgi:hypothetical protein